MKDKVIQLYEHFFQITSNNPNFEFRPKIRDKKMIETFVSKLNVSQGPDWLFNYFCYQFQRYADKKTRFGKGIVMLGWVIGDKALKRYSEASDEEKYYGEKFRLDHNISNPLTIRTPVDTRSYRQREKKRFYNQVRGLIHCKENDLKYDQKDKLCMFCKNKKECEIWKNN
jgi:hypothetical protein